MIPSFIGLFFGGLWLFLGVQAAPAPWGLIAGSIGALLFLAGAVRIPSRKARGGHFDGRWYMAAVIAEVAAIMLAQRWLTAHHRDDLLFPAVGVIVGLHFLGLWRAMGLRRFIALAAVLVAINLVALLPGMAPSVRLMISGFGSAAALLLSAAA